jgi:hypothetical protein
VTADPASRGSKDFKLVAANNHWQIFHKIMERNANSVVAIGVVGPMIKKKSQPMVTCNLSWKTYYN